MRLFIALAATAALCAIAAPAAAQSKECKAFRSGEGWAVKYVAYTRADGRVFDTVTTYTYQVIMPPDDKGDTYDINANMQRLSLPEKGVVLLEYGKRPDGENVKRRTGVYRNRRRILGVVRVDESDHRQEPFIKRRLVHGPSRGI